VSSVPLRKASYQSDQPQLMASAGTAQGCWVVMVQDRRPAVVVAALQLRPAASIVAVGLRGWRHPQENCWKSLQTDWGRPAGHSLAHQLAHQLATLGQLWGACVPAHFPAPPPAMTQRPAAGRQRVEHISSVHGP